MIDIQAMARLQARLEGEARAHLRKTAERPAGQDSELRSLSETQRTALRQRLLNGLRRERMKARSGHAGYDFNRHLALHQMIRAIDAASSGRDRATA